MEDKVNTSNNNNSFSIKKIVKNTDGVSFDIRQHSLYELVCISKGNIKLTIDFQTYDLKENTVYLIKTSCNIAHTNNNTIKYKIILIMLFKLLITLN